MKILRRHAPFLAIGILLLLMTGCGGGGGGTPPGPNDVSTVSVTSSKNLALANGTDAVTITASVTKVAGGAVADGTTVTFTVASGTATLSSTNATTVAGVASVTVTHAPITGAKNETDTFTATASGVNSAAGASIKFINNPSSATVDIALDVPFTGLSAIDFVLAPNGATYASSSLINEANVTGALILAPGNDAYAFFSPNTGVNTVANKPIFHFTFTINPTTITSLPSFTLQQPSNGFQVVATSPTTVAASDFILTTVFDTQ